MSLTRKDKIRQYKAIRRINSLYYKYKRELEMADFKFVGAMIWRKSCKKDILHKEVIFTKEERLKIKALAKRYLKKKKNE
jgi:hypothetical protein